MQSFKALGFLVLMFSTGLFQAQNYIVSGRVQDAETQAIIKNAVIFLSNHKDTLQTDADGVFRFEAGKKQDVLTATAEGYQPQTIDFSPSDADLTIRLEPKYISINSVVIKSFNSFIANKETPAAISVLPKATLEQGSAISIQDALNTVPGVRMDQTGVAEGRLSIRGMGARAPWGIRKVRVYLNDIPLTGADGITSWDDVNVNEIGRVEIIRGPSSSIYGAGTIGGVINFEMNRAKAGQNQLTTSAIAGSYGLKRIVTNYQSGTKNLNSYLSYGYQEIGGYRDHSNDVQRFLAGNFQFYPSDKQTVSLMIYRGSQFSQLPGQLTEAEVLQNRRQGAPGDLEGNSRRYVTRTRIGINSKYRFTDRLSNSTSVYSYTQDFSEPLPYGVTAGPTLSVGVRSFFTYEPDFNLFKTKFIAGLEVDQDRVKSQLYQNVKGEEGELWSNMNFKNTLYTYFYQSETQLFPKMKLTVGASFSGLNYNVKDLINPGQSGVKRFKGRLSPRAALSYDFGTLLTLHASVSTGYDPPTTDEIRNADQSINQNIDAEKALNYELDAKGAYQRLNYDLALYKMNVKGELIAQNLGNELTIFQNSGKTLHEGMELSLGYQILKENDHHFISDFQPYASLTYSHFRFDQYQVLDAQGAVIADYKGNSIPGVGRWMAFVGTTIQTRNGFYLDANMRFNDRYALNDANTDFNPSYTVVNGKIGYKTHLGRHFNLNIYAGLNNLTNTQYSSFTAINAVANGTSTPAYFEPSPRINGYGGLSLTYLLK